jgi:phosphoribosylformimino-5-aminoimidazole carboxamide ribotide isomerase
MLAGPNGTAMAEMQKTMAPAGLGAAGAIGVIASGGVTTAADVAELAKVPMAGAIVGRALYEGKLKLADALAAAKNGAGAG